MAAKAKKIISTVAESILDSAEDQVKQTVSSAIDQVGLTNWLYGKAPSEAQLQQATAAEQGNKANLEKIEDEVRSMAQKGGSDAHEAVSQPDARSATPDATSGQQKSEGEQRMVIEHHQEAERLGQDRSDQKKTQEQQQKEKDMKEREKAEKKEIKRQALDTPIEAQGKAKTGTARKKNKTRMMIKQMQTTKTERKAQGVGG